MFGKLNYIILEEYSVHVGAYNYYKPQTYTINCHSLCIQIMKQDQPTLPLLIDFPSSTGRGLNVTQEIGVHYKQFGLLLLNDRSGASITAIEHHCHYRAAAINCEILQRWIQGSGKQPVTWETLVKVLKQVELKTLASQIESSLYVRSVTLV